MIKDIENIGNITHEKFNNIANIILDIIKEQLAGLLKFLFDKNIIQVGIGLIIATNINKMTNLITDHLIYPIINKFISSNLNGLEEHKSYVFGMEFKTGIIITNFINFILIIIVVYYLWKLSQMTDFEFINETLNKIKI